MQFSLKPERFTSERHDPTDWVAHDLYLDGARIVGARIELGRPRGSSRYEPSPVYLGQVYRSLTGAPDAATSLAPIAESEYRDLVRLIAAAHRDIAAV